MSNSIKRPTTMKGNEIAQYLLAAVENLNERVDALEKENTTLKRDLINTNKSVKRIHSEALTATGKVRTLKESVRVMSETVSRISTRR